MLPMPCMGLMGAVGSAPDLASQVATLFAAMSGPKLWFDPSDPATRFQDQAGTTLVTADGQPYGRADDKSGGGNHVGQATAGSRPLWKTDGVLSWAQPDGTDDFWQSLVNFDMTATDKLTVIAGVRKESEAAQAVVAELGPNASTNAGSWVLFAPPGAGINTVQFRSGGTTLAIATGDATAPISQVLTGISSIAGPFVTLRMNGAVAQTTATTQGTGNLGSYLLNFFRRGGATLPFGGRLYGLMIFGRLLTADELSLCERYMAQKTGVALP